MVDILNIIIIVIMSLGIIAWCIFIGEVLVTRIKEYKELKKEHKEESLWK